MACTHFLCMSRKLLGTTFAHFERASLTDPDGWPGWNSAGFSSTKTEGIDLEAVVSLAWPAALGTFQIAFVQQLLPGPAVPRILHCVSALRNSCSKSQTRGRPLNKSRQLTQASMARHQCSGPRVADMYASLHLTSKAHHRLEGFLVEVQLQIQPGSLPGGFREEGYLHTLESALLCWKAPNPAAAPLAGTNVQSQLAELKNIMMGTICARHGAR